MVNLHVVIFHMIVINITLTNFPQLSLNGLNSIIGRGVVVHAGMDDLGRVRKSQ